MLNSDKAYVAQARLGVVTETGDADGTIIGEYPVPSDLQAEDIESCLAVAARAY